MLIHSYNWDRKQTNAEKNIISILKNIIRILLCARIESHKIYFHQNL